MNKYGALELGMVIADCITVTGKIFARGILFIRFADLFITMRRFEK